MLGERSVASRFEAQHDSELIEFVGRDSEVSLLLERWAWPATAKARSCCCRAKPASASRASARPCATGLPANAMATVLLQCSPYHSSSALYPLVQYFERTAGMAPADSPRAARREVPALDRPEMDLPPQSLGCFCA